jgi:hypothetical protein
MTRSVQSRQVKSKVKSMLILAGQTVNSAYYCDVLRRLSENMRRLRPELWKPRNLLLQYNNAPSHTSFFKRGFLTNNMSVAPHPRLKIKLIGRHFDTIEVLEAKSLAVPNTHRTQFQDAFKRWQKR